MKILKDVGEVDVGEEKTWMNASSKFFQGGSKRGESLTQKTFIRVGTRLKVSMSFVKRECYCTIVLKQIRITGQKKSHFFRLLLLFVVLFFLSKRSRGACDGNGREKRG